VDSLVDCFLEEKREIKRGGEQPEGEKGENSLRLSRDRNTASLPQNGSARDCVREAVGKQ
jgi:hypothetical protein